MTTTEQLRALLPVEPNGAPPSDGWYVVDVDGDICAGFWSRNARFPHIGSGHGIVSDESHGTFSGSPVRHAPLRLESGETAQALTALHLAGFEGGILEAVGACLGALDSARDDAHRFNSAGLVAVAGLNLRIANLEAREAGMCPRCSGSGAVDGMACAMCGGDRAVLR